jgi:vacuolar-type H+-ATPase subunit F/Vma7
MARLVVVTNPGLADGFRLAGSATLAAHPGPDAAAAVRSAVADVDVGLVLVTADVWQWLEPRARGELERLARPIVLPIPAGVVTDATTRRELLGEMLERAIGYRIELASGASQ